MPNTQVTYSEPTVTRTATESTIEYDVHREGWTGWESICIERHSGGDIGINEGRDHGVRIPAHFFPLVLAEIDRIVAADGDLPLTPPAPVAAIAPRDPAACYICGRAEHEPDELHKFWSNAEAQRDFEGIPDGLMPSMTAAETLDPREAVIR